MLRSLKDLERYTVTATDGNLGSVSDFLVDDQRWAVRYLVVETGNFFNERKVLISPISFRHADWETHHFNVALTREQVKKSPGIDTEKPVSRQHEREYYGYYGYSYYWGYPGLWGVGDYPRSLTSDASHDAAVGERAEDTSGDAHLRSVAAMRAYRLRGKDETLGHVHDFIVDDASWEVRYLAVDTHQWWFGKKVLIAQKWVSDISWDLKEVHVDLTRKAIRKSPAWNGTDLINREYETRLYDYYGRPMDWATEDRPNGAVPPRPAASHVV